MIVHHFAVFALHRPPSAFIQCSICLFISAISYTNRLLVTLTAIYLLRGITTSSFFCLLILWIWYCLSFWQEAYRRSVYVEGYSRRCHKLFILSSKLRMYVTYQPQYYGILYKSSTGYSRVVCTGTICNLDRRVSTQPKPCITPPQCDGSRRWLKATQCEGPQ